ncbi:MAG: hypothetical protein ACYTFY_22310 [Planctomycetota bacterium]|jgi:hypothetical protein
MLSVNLYYNKLSNNFLGEKLYEKRQKTIRGKAGRKSGRVRKCEGEAFDNTPDSYRRKECKRSLRRVRSRRGNVPQAEEQLFAGLGRSPGAQREIEDLELDLDAAYARTEIALVMPHILTEDAKKIKKRPKLLNDIKIEDIESLKNTPPE